MKTSPRGSYEHEILGNRLTGPELWDQYGWDALGRMTSLRRDMRQSEYVYRADGMRVAKSSHAGSVVNKLTVMRYDGQMPVETVEATENGGVTTVDTAERHGVGARGLDLIERTTSSGTITGFPLYDGHGNNVATLTRSGSSFSLGDQRSYDAWGSVRTGASSGAPNSRYCASLGHVQDDESGLVYMRARCYEAGMGRFVSEDKKGDGNNWFAYCSNDPVNKVDRDGDWSEWAGLAVFTVGVALFFMGLTLLGVSWEYASTARVLERTIARMTSYLANPGTGVCDLQALALVAKRSKEAELGTARARSVGAKAAGYTMILMGLLLDIDLAPDGDFDILTTVFGGGK